MNARISSAIALVATAGLALTACFPPNENPSDTKVDTATEQKADSFGGSEAKSSEASATDAAATTGASATAEPAADEEVMVIDCFGQPQSEPTTLSADCTDPTGSQVSEITWDEWTAESATGTGTSAEGKEATIELADPTDNGNGLVFSTVTVDGKPVSN